MGDFLGFGVRADGDEVLGGDEGFLDFEEDLGSFIEFHFEEDDVGGFDFEGFFDLEVEAEGDLELVCEVADSAAEFCRDLVVHFYVF